MIDVFCMLIAIHNIYELLLYIIFWILRVARDKMSMSAAEGEKEGDQIGDAVANFNSNGPTMEADADDVNSSIAALSSTTTAVKSNNRAANYTATEHLNVYIPTIEKNEVLKPASSDSCFVTIARATKRDPEVCASHWNQILSYVKIARSKLAEESVTHPPILRDSSSAEAAINDALCAQYFSALLSKMQSNSKNFGAKSWWSLEVVQRVCQMQMRSEHEEGLDKKQDADTLDEMHKTAKNKFAAEMKLKLEEMRKRKERDEKERFEDKEEQRTFKKSMLSAVELLASGINTAMNSSPAASQVSGMGDSFGAGSIGHTRIENLEAKVESMETKLDSMLEILQGIASSR